MNIAAKNQKTMEAFDNDPRNPVYQKAPEQQEEPCQECDGTGHTGLSSCCGAPMKNYPDSDLCPECHDHSDDECQSCNGTGNN